MTVRELSSLSALLANVFSVEEKLAILNQHKSVAQTFSSLFADGFLTPEQELIVKELIAIGQWDRLQSDGCVDDILLKECLEKLVVVHSFYAPIGGLVGYQAKITAFLQEGCESRPIGIAYHSPSFIHIDEETEEVLDAIYSGICALPQMAELYPLGGAADRLHLIDELTGEELPAANLPFAGRSLLVGLVQDVQAREFLYYKLFNKQLLTPIAIMTSREKNNWNHLLNIFEAHHWFGREKSSIQFFVQPSVPAVDQEGNWHVQGSFKPLLKPGGHGVIWKLARDMKVLEWLKAMGTQKGVVRQINNPLASIDYGLLAFIGIGCEREMFFGFASCPRLLRSAEGVNVLIETEEGKIILTNIEYCDFAKFGIQDVPLKEGDIYSQYSSNTNILFFDLNAIESAVEKCPFPGLLINLKKVQMGEAKQEVMMARLESTMQNIADTFGETKRDSLATQKTFITYNRREKTIATVKKRVSYPISPYSLEETPENCFYLQLKAARELLESYCEYELSEPYSLARHLEKAPDLLFLYHPALGPLYSVIRQKIKRGKIAPHSEIQLHLSDLALFDLSLNGSLQIYAENPIGHFTEEGRLVYSEKTGRCLLRHVKIENEGIDWELSRPFWKNQLVRKQSLEIILEGCSEFAAIGVHFAGNHRFIVPDGQRMEVSQKNGLLCVEMSAVPAASLWRYETQKRRVCLAARDFSAS